MRSKLADYGDQILGAPLAGLSLRAACKAVGVPEATVRGWLRRGNKEEGTRHAAFAAAMEVARGQSEQNDPPGDRLALQPKCGDRCGRGRCRRQSCIPQSVIDELALRRAREDA